MRQLRIYLSSTFEDLKAFRAAVLAKLEQAGLDVAQMEGYTATDERPVDMCLRDVAESNIYVGLFAWRYGYEPPAEHGNPLGRSITDLEYRQAEERNLRKLLFFAHPDTQAGWPDRFVDERTGQGERGAKLTRFRNELGTEKLASFFRTPQELAALVLAAIMRSGKSGRVYNIPPRPPGFVPRPGLTDAIVLALTGPGGGVPGTNTLVQGAGGFGKTTLAIDACHRAEVISAFPDGLLWTVLGEEPDLARVLADLYGLVTGSPPAVAGAEEIGKALGRALAGRRCVLVVDDAWRADDLAPFLKLVGPVLLITTRVRSLIEQTGQTGWPEVPVDEMDESEAAGVLGRGLTLDEAMGEALEHLADRLGCWPLLLDLANARLLEESKSRPGKLADCIARVTLLFERKGVLGFDRRDSTSRNAAIARSVEVGLDRAEEMVPGLAEKAAELSVFAEDLAIPVHVLADLWSLDPLLVEEDVLKHLDNLSLVRWDRETDTVRLHDMIRRALEVRLGEPVSVHRRLIDVWSEPGRQPNEYTWRWFGWHCVRADQQERWLNLLCNVHYLHAKLDATDVDALLGDFELLTLEPLPGLESLYRTLRMSAHVLSKDKSQFFGQLLGRVPEGNDWLREHIQLCAQAVREPWLRPMRPTLMSPGGALLRTLEGHTGDVTSVAITPDGRRAVSGSRDKTLRIWDLQSGKTLRTLEGHAAQVLDVVITSDGKRAISAGYDHTLKIWDLERGALLHTLEGHAEGVTNVAVTPDGKRAVSAGYDQTLRIWDVERGKALHILEGLAEGPYSVVITPDGQRAVSGSNDKTLKIWEIESGKLLSTFAGDKVLAITSDGQHLISGDGTTLSIRRLDSGDVLQTLDDYGGPPVALSRDGRVLVASGQYDHSLKVWDLESGKELRTLRGHSSHVLAVVLTPDGRRSLSGSRDGTLKLWDLAAVERAVSNEGHEGVKAIAITPDGQRAVSAGSDWQLMAWDIEGGRLLFKLEGHEGGVNAVAITPDGRCAVSASSDKTLKVWDLDSGKVLRTLEGHAESVIAVAITPNGEHAVSASDDHTLKIWNLEQGKLVRTLEGHTASVDGVLITSDGRQAVSASKDNTMKVWDLMSGEMLRSDEIELPNWTFVHHSVMALTPLADLIAIGREETLYYWDLERGKVVDYFKAHDALLTAVAFTPGGERAVSASNDRTVAIWDFDARKVLATFVLDSAVVAATIACDGKVVVAADHAGYVHFLRFENALDLEPACSIKDSDSEHEPRS